MTLLNLLATDGDSEAKQSRCTNSALSFSKEAASPLPSVNGSQRKFVPAIPYARMQGGTLALGVRR